MELHEHNCATCGKKIKVVVGPTRITRKDSHLKLRYQFPFFEVGRAYHGGWQWFRGSEYVHWECPECIGFCYGCPFDSNCSECPMSEADDS